MGEELTSLLGNQFKEKSLELKERLNNFFDDKSKRRVENLEKLKESNASEDQIKMAMDQLDAAFNEEQASIEKKIIQEFDMKHIQEQMKLRQRHTGEVVSAVKQLLPEDATTDLEKLEAEQEKFRQKLQNEKEERIKKIEEERVKMNEELQIQQEAEI